MNELHVDSVTKRIGDRQILNDVFISCKPGEIIGLLGRNGSGKSTLLKIIQGSLNADNKFVSIDNKKINSLYDIRKLVQYLPQAHFLPNHVQIKSIIKCYCDAKNATDLTANELVHPHLKKKPNELSGGERRTLEILLLIYSGAKYILLDEPFNGISPLHTDQLKALVKQHSKEKGFIITDHDYRNVLEISSKIILLDNGNTKVVKHFNDLVELGYLPESAKSAPNCFNWQIESETILTKF